MKMNLKTKTLFIFLISVGIINAKTLHQKLVSAIKGENIEEVRNLIKKYAQAGVKKGTPQLILAARTATIENDIKMAEITTILLDNNQNPVVQDGLRMTPLMWAAKKGAIEVLKVLLGTERGKATIELKDEEGNTALILATMGSDTDKRHLAVAKTLLQNKARPNIMNNEGKTALSYATQADNRGMIHLLHRYRASPPVRR